MPSQLRTSCGSCAVALRRTITTTRILVSGDGSGRRRLVQIDLQIVRRAAGADDVELAVAVEVGEHEVFTGDLGVDERLAPLAVRGIGGGEDLDADVVRIRIGRIAAPADDD